MGIINGTLLNIEIDRSAAQIVLNCVGENIHHDTLNVNRRADYALVLNIKVHTRECNSALLRHDLYRESYFFHILGYVHDFMSK